MILEVIWGRGKVDFDLGCKLLRRTCSNSVDVTRLSFRCLSLVRGSVVLEACSCANKGREDGNEKWGRGEECKCI